MQKEFFIYLSLLIVLISSVTLHYIIFDKSRINNSVTNLVKITNISELSLGAGALGNRFLILQQQNSNPIYPDMLTLNKEGFVYAK